MGYLGSLVGEFVDFAISPLAAASLNSLLRPRFLALPQRSVPIPQHHQDCAAS